jgi:hypothetical protein
MKEADGLQVARDRSDVDVLHSETSGLRDGLLGKECPYPATPTTRIHDDRLQLGLLSTDEEPAQATKSICELRNPKSVELWVLEVSVELEPRVWATERRIVVDVAMALREAAPQRATAIEIAGSILPNGR